MRELFLVINTNEAAIISLRSLALQSKETEASVKTAYYAAAEMARAKYLLSPAAKLKTFKSGKKILELCLAKDSMNVEVRYIRYTIQTNAPSFLGYNQNIQNDKLFLVDHLPSLKKTDSELFTAIYVYLIYSHQLTGPEQQQLSKHSL
jgi:hypothetical protein